jgi:hypothetical protein
MSAFPNQDKTQSLTTHTGRNNFHTKSEYLNGQDSFHCNILESFF